MAARCYRVGRWSLKISFRNWIVKVRSSIPWIVCQLGAREHFAIPRALHAAGRLDRLMTDVWCPPRSWLRKVPALSRWHDRYHDDLEDAVVKAWPVSFAREEFSARRIRLRGWDRIRHRNEWFQDRVVAELVRVDDLDRRFFSYSYTASRLLPLCRQRGWLSVIGQIDPGPEEERIVAAEHERYAHVPSNWRPAPPEYWDDWRSEMEMADRILVNSQWSADCLAKEDIGAGKVNVVPLVFQHSQRSAPVRGELDHEIDFQPVKDAGESIGRKPIPPQKSGLPMVAFSNSSANAKVFEVLFLGQINLRKGIGRLIDAMKLLKDDSRIQLTLAGPTEINASFWADLPKVRWIGPVRRSEVLDIYLQSDVFILPTLSDGYALTQLEALAAGVPVIASRHCGQAVRHGQNGWLLDNLEPATIAKALVHACEHPDELSWEGVSNPFGIEQLGKHLLNMDYYSLRTL